MLTHFLSHTVVCLHSLQLTDANFKDHHPLFPTLWAVLVQAGIINYCRPGGLNNEHLFLTVLETRSPKSGCQLDWVPVRAWFWVPDCEFFLCALKRQKEGKRALWREGHLSCKGTNLIMRGHPHELIISQRLHFLILSRWELGFWPKDLEGTQAVSRLHRPPLHDLYVISCPLSILCFLIFLPVSLLSALLAFGGGGGLFSALPVI